MAGVSTLSMIARYGILPALPVSATGPRIRECRQPGIGAGRGCCDERHCCPSTLNVAWDSFWCVVQNGINTAADLMGVDVTILAPDEFRPGQDGIADRASGRSQP